MKTEEQQPLLVYPNNCVRGDERSDNDYAIANEEEREKERAFGGGKKTWEEVKKTWRIAWPCIFCRLAMFSLTIITQSLAGHLSDLDLAALSINTTLIFSISFGFLIGMASALETLCGQAYGARQHHMLGIYMQRSLIVLSCGSILLLPMFMFASPLLRMLGQSAEVAERAGLVAKWLIPMHLSVVFQFSLQKFLQSQMKTAVIAWSGAAALAVHAIVSYVLVYRLGIGIVGAALTLGFSWWVSVFILCGYVACGGCPGTWNGFSWQAFSGLWDFSKLALASGFMFLLEHINNICRQCVIRVRVAIELGAGNTKGAKFAAKVCLLMSLLIGLMFFSLVIALPERLAMIFTPSPSVVSIVVDLSFLSGFTILLNSIPPVLLGIAVGSGWQALGVYVNIGSYYLVGFPLGIYIGWMMGYGYKGIWSGMLAGTVLQMLLLTIIIFKRHWKIEVQRDFGKHLLLDKAATD